MNESESSELSGDAIWPGKGGRLGWVWRELLDKQAELFMRRLDEVSDGSWRWVF